MRTSVHAFSGVSRKSFWATQFVILAIGCGDDDALRGGEGDGGRLGSDAGDSGSGSVDDDGGVEPPDEDSGLQACRTDDQCIDHLTCDGQERCEAGRCVEGIPLVCSSMHPCLEELGGCDCRVPDLDEDDYQDAVCDDGPFGGDCDDHRPDVHPGANEVCDPGVGLDEDCDFRTFYDQDTPYDGDADHDEYVSQQCFNVGPDGLIAGDDCRDNNPSTHPEVPEVCDYEDNDCDGVIDERLGADGVGLGVEGGLREDFYPDTDSDRCGDMFGEPRRECGFLPMPGFVAGDPCDCNDSRLDVLIGATEVCDGVDNDCDGLTDQADKTPPVFLNPYDFEGAEVICIADPNDATKPRWDIECSPGRAWCTGIVETGCSTDATTLTNCGDCGVTCNFSCGAGACDELEHLALGRNHSCATTHEGQVTCWGQGAGGRLGNGVIGSRSIPTKVLALEDSQKIAAGPDFSCAIEGAISELFCWGGNSYGQLANGDSEGADSVVPLPLASPYDDELRLSAVKGVAVSERFGCAIVRDGDLLCWGEDANGQLANGSSTTSEFPQLPAIGYDVDYNELTNVELVAVGQRHACAVIDGELLCWGDNALGQLGNRSIETVSEVAVPVPGIGPVDAISAGLFYTCAVSSGDVYCWGVNSRLQLGRASGDDDDIPQLVQGLPEIKSVHAGTNFTCALTVAGSVYCWGANDSGQRGDVDPSDSATPVLVDIQDVVELAVGGGHACAIDSARQGRCWGGNVYGQLGVGRTFQSVQAEPLEIKPLENED